MKGVMDFLEKAGLVKQEIPASPGESPISVAASLEQGPAAPPVAPVTVAPVVSPANAVAASPVTAALNFSKLYANAGVPASLYPAERLLRLIDGLSAMDETTRKLAIKAMDEADESWTIADPLRDADAKLMVLADHGATIQQGLQELEAETQKQLTSVRARQALRSGEIRKQMSELEALLAREVARGDNECAAKETSLAEARAQVAGTLRDIAQASDALRRLGDQFGSQIDKPNTPSNN